MQTEAAATRTATKHAQQAEALMQTSRSVQITVESSVWRANLWTATNTTNTIDQFPSEAIAAHRLHRTSECAPRPIDI